MKHVCGLMGFNSMLGDTCEKCDSQRVDMMNTLGYGSETNNGESRSNTVSEDNRNEMTEAADYDEFEEEMEFSDEDGYNVLSFLSDLESFLDSKLDDVTRGNVFLSENKHGVTVNLLIGTPFADSDLEINQINVIVSPTDREFLGSEGVSMGAEESDEDGNLFFDTREQAREHARSSGAKFEDKGQAANQGKRWSTHEAFDNAMSHFNGE